MRVDKFMGASMAFIAEKYQLRACASLQRRNMTATNNTPHAWQPGVRGAARSACNKPTSHRNLDAKPVRDSAAVATTVLHSMPRFTHCVPVVGTCFASLALVVGANARRESRSP
jgi:hypothetical protein